MSLSDVGGLVLRFVDPHFCGQLGDAGRPVDEALGVLLIGSIHHHLSLHEHRRGLVGVDGRRREPRDAFVFVLVVVVMKNGAHDAFAWEKP